VTIVAGRFSTRSTDMVNRKPWFEAE
jgi:hypothetical protein